MRSLIALCVVALMASSVRADDVRYFDESGKPMTVAVGANGRVYKVTTVTAGMCNCGTTCGCLPGTCPDRCPVLVAPVCRPIYPAAYPTAYPTYRLAAPACPSCQGGSCQPAGGYRLPGR